MKTLLALLTLSLSALLIGCASIASPEYHNFDDGSKWKIEGEMKPMQGWTGKAHISINGDEVIRKPLPWVGNHLLATGEYEGREITVEFVKIQKFMSHYWKAEVKIEGEHAANLTF